MGGVKLPRRAERLKGGMESGPTGAGRAKWPERVEPPPGRLSPSARFVSRDLESAKKRGAYKLRSAVNPQFHREQRM